MAERNFNWGDAYMQSLQDPMRATPGLAPEGVMGGIDLVNSGRNVAGGQGDFLDYLTLALAPTAFAGYGIGQGVKAAARAADPAIARILAERVLRNPSVSVRFPSEVSADLVNSGRFKNSMELGLDSGFNVITPQARLNAENLAYGVPLSAAAADRPIYGMLTANSAIPSTRLMPESAKLSQATMPAHSGISYGDSLAVFKNPSGKFSAGDSFSANPGPNWNLGQVPAEFAQNPAMAFRSNADRYVTGADDAYRAATRQRPQSLEAIIPAREAMLSNVDYFMVSSKAKKEALQRLLKQQGYSTPVRVNRNMNEPMVNKFSLPNLPSLGLSEPPKIPGFGGMK